jgi:predicted amidophosphoribosyltransferase
MAYTAEAKLLLRAFKELGESSLAYQIAQSMTPLLGCFEEFPTRLVPIPSNFKSIRERGFNPAEIIAREIAVHYPNLRFENLLTRTRQTLDQSKLTPFERSDNQLGSMLARVGGEQIILIDDVVTTGATLKEATSALENAGHSVIGFLTFAETEAKRCNLATQATSPADGGTSWNSKFPQKI